MNKDKINELREKLNNITNDQLSYIADILYDKVVDPEQHIIDAFNEFKDRLDYTDDESSFAEKTNNYGKYPKAFYAGFKAAEKIYKK